MYVYVLRNRSSLRNINYIETLVQHIIIFFRLQFDVTYED